MLALATLFRAILVELRAVIGAHAARPDLARDPARQALLLLAWSYVGRTAARFARLYTLWHAGALPTPRPRRPPRASRPVTAPAAPRLPSGCGWLVHILGHQSANLGSQLTHLLARPDAGAFLQQVPRAARLLRPIFTALGRPDPLPRPPRPPKPRKPAPPKPEPVTPKHGKYRPAEIRRYRPGRISITRPA